MVDKEHARRKLPPEENRPCCYFSGYNVNHLSRKRVDPTLMLYLRGTGEVGMGTGDKTLTVAGGELCPVAGGGEEGRTQGLKLCPPWVLAMPG